MNSELKTLITKRNFVEVLKTSRFSLLLLQTEEILAMFTVIVTLSIVKALPIIYRSNFAEIKRSDFVFEGFFVVNFTKIFEYFIISFFFSVYLIENFTNHFVRFCGIHLEI